MKRISTRVKTFKPGKFDVRKKSYSNRPLMYGSKGEEMEVKRWIRWPSYDFIFATPCSTSKMWKDERGFFQYRDSRKGRKGWACYFDLGELKELAEGFAALLKHAEERELRASGPAALR